MQEQILRGWNRYAFPCASPELCSNTVRLTGPFPSPTVLQWRTTVLNTTILLLHPGIPCKQINFINDEHVKRLEQLFHHALGLALSSALLSLSKRGTIWSYSEQETLSSASDKHLCDSEVHRCVQEEMRSWMNKQAQAAKGLESRRPTKAWVLIG